MRGTLLGAVAASRSAAFTKFAQTLSSCYTSIQTDFGFTYGTPKPTATNTSTTVVTQSGTITGANIPLLVKATNTLAVGSGAQFSVYADGGTTAFMTGVTPTAATPVALTGVGAGLSLTWSAGTSVANDTWKATCSQLTDQSAGGMDFIQATAARQPLVTVGVGGKCGLLFDVSNVRLGCAALNFPTPPSTPHMFFAVLRMTSWVSNGRIFDADASGAAGLIWMRTASPGINMFNGNDVAHSTGLAVGTFGAIGVGWGGATTDYLRAGSAAASTGATAGALTGTTGRIIGNDGTNPVAGFELLSFSAAAPQSETAARALTTVIYGGTVNV